MASRCHDEFFVTAILEWAGWNLVSHLLSHGCLDTGGPHVFNEQCHAFALCFIRSCLGLVGTNRDAGEVSPVLSLPCQCCALASRSTCDDLDPEHLC